MKKRIGVWMMLLAVLLGLAAVGRADGGDWAIVSNPNPEDRLNLRTRASTDAVSLGKYYNGVVVSLLSGNVNGWYKVSIGPLTGYMDATYLVVGAQAGSVVSAMPTVTIRNNGGTGANLRTGQSTASRSLGLYANGTKATVYGVSEDWLHVRMEDGSEGFILASLATPRISFSAGSGTQAGGNTAVVFNGDTVSRLNLRTAPTGDAPTLGKYYSGVIVTLLSGNEGGWYNVRIGNLEGYMKASYLIVGGGAEVSAEVNTMPSVTVQRTTRLYTNMSTSGTYITSLRQGDVLAVMGVSTDYLHVRTSSGSVGFVLASDVSPAIPFNLN